jgi:hypothetical protein
MCREGMNMKRKTYERLITEISNSYLNKELEAGHFATNAVNNVLLAEGIEIPKPELKPISEQEWDYCGVGGIPTREWEVYPKNLDHPPSEQELIARVFGRHDHARAIAELPKAIKVVKMVRTQGNLDMKFTPSSWKMITDTLDRMVDPCTT